MDIETKNNEVQIRYVANFKELEKISHIDSLSFYNHCNRKCLENILRNKKAFAVVALKEEEIVGYILYYVKNNKYIIVRMAVHPEHRRQGCGKLLIEKIGSKLSLLTKNIEIVVKETNIQAQLFLKSMNFVVVDIIRENFTTYHDDLPSVPYVEDGIVFRFDK